MKYRIIFQTNDKTPESHEVHAAIILANYFHSDIEIIKRGSLPSPDFLIKNVRWELKSPTGTGKHNIQHTLQDATRQSKNVILDSSRSKMDMRKVRSEALRQFKIIRSIKRLILITKSGEVIELER